jgi:DNA-binding FrmR family transcriptional regulator
VKASCASLLEQIAALQAAHEEVQFAVTKTCKSLWRLKLFEI